MKIHLWNQEMHRSLKIFFLVGKLKKQTREQRDSTTSEAEENSLGTITVEETVKEPEEQPRRSKRARKEKSFGDDFLMAFLTENVPRTYSEAMSTRDAPFWKEAVNNEIDSILKHHTYEIADLPKVLNHWGVNEFSLLKGKQMVILTGTRLGLWYKDFDKKKV